MKQLVIGHLRVFVPRMRAPHQMICHFFECKRHIIADIVWPMSFSKKKQCSRNQGKFLNSPLNDCSILMMCPNSTICDLLIAVFYCLLKSSVSKSSIVCTIRYYRNAALVSILSNEDFAGNVLSNVRSRMRGRNM